MVTAPPDRLKEQIRAELQAAARAGKPTTYRLLAKKLDLRPPLTIHRVTTLLEEMMAEDVAAGQPLLSAACISQALQKLPRVGFFIKAKELGLFRGDPEGPQAREFHTRELQRLFDHFASQPA